MCVCLFMCSSVYFCICLVYVCIYVCMSVLRIGVGTGGGGGEVGALGTEAPPPKIFFTPGKSLTITFL